MSTKVNQPRRRHRAALLSIASICAISLPAAALVAAAPSFAEDDFGNGKKVSQGAIAGDGPVVAESHLNTDFVDGVGATWSIYAQSGATGEASEASFQTPIAASTELGGTNVDSLGDAFDDYNSLSTFVGPGATRLEATDYGTGEAVPTTECGGRQLVFAADESTPGLTVSRKLFIPADAGYGRWTNILTNTSNAAVTTTLFIDNNLGSDDDTVIFNTSSGDTTTTTADTWVGTFEDYDSAGISGDPRIGHVLQGNGAPSTMIQSTFTNGNDNPEWAYELTLQPGQTRSILNFAVLRGFKAEAAAAAASIAATTPNACMTHTEANTVANFIVGARPTLTLPANVQREATGPNGATAEFSASAVDGNNQPVPVTCTPASGSVFPVGVTTVTCTATDPQGRTSTGTFTVTVNALLVSVVPGVCEGATVTIQATPGVVTLGTPGKDVILGTAASDTISALGGNDVICGVGGNDVINAGLGDDTVAAGDGDDNVRGGRGADEVLADDGNDNVRGGNGPDVVIGGDGDDTVSGGRSADKVTSGAGDDNVKGGEGNDNLRGNSGKDRLVGLRGNDKVSGGGGNDQLAGNRGDDKLTGGSGTDELRGGPGRDMVDGVEG